MCIRDRLWTPNGVPVVSEKFAVTVVESTTRIFETMMPDPALIVRPETKFVPVKVTATFVSRTPVAGSIAVNVGGPTCASTGASNARNSAIVIRKIENLLKD